MLLPLWQSVTTIDMLDSNCNVAILVTATNIIMRVLASVVICGGDLTVNRSAKHSK